MSNEATSTMNRPPAHLWIVGVVSLLWNAMGAFDYIMTETRNESYMSRFTPEQMDFFTGFPAWVVTLWAIAVWGGVVGSVLLLLKKRLAAPVFLVSLLGMVGTTIHNYILSNGLEVVGGTGPVLFSVVIFVVSIALYVYARKLAQRNVLS